MDIKKARCICLGFFIAWVFNVCSFVTHCTVCRPAWHLLPYMCWKLLHVFNAPEIHSRHKERTLHNWSWSQIKGYDIHFLRCINYYPKYICFMLELHCNILVLGSDDMEWLSRRLDQ